ncbi:MAG: Fe-S-containing protein [Thermodesulfovibrionales bacterium]
MVTKQYMDTGSRAFSYAVMIPLMVFVLFLQSCTKQPLYQEPVIIDDMVIVNTSQLIEKRPVFFSYQYNKKMINFFVIKIEGKVSSYLDACAKCYPKKLGFGFDNGYIYCRACNVRHPVENIEKGFGSCYPIKIAGEEQQGKYFISLKTLQEKVDKF